MRQGFTTGLQFMVKQGINQSLKKATNCTLLLFYVYFLLDNWKPILHAALHSPTTFLHFVEADGACISLCNYLLRGPWIWLMHASA